jgi:hypothetical protein
MKTENNTIAKVIQQSINPDNLAKLPMIINSTYNASQVTITIKKAKKVDTILSTLQDLLSACDVAENIIKQSKRR